jgi:hypothetical protein
MENSLKVPKLTKADYGYCALKSIIDTIPIAGPIASELFQFLITAPIEKDLFKWRNRIVQAILSLDKRIGALEKKDIKILWKIIESNENSNEAYPIETPIDFLSREILNDLIQLPQKYRYNVFKLKAILPNDVKYLNEPTRKALRLPTSFIERYQIECFANISKELNYVRIPNGDYHINLLLSKSAFDKYQSFLCNDFYFKPFSWLPIGDQKTIENYSTELSVMYIGHNKIYRTTSGKEAGLFFELIGSI